MENLKYRLYINGRLRMSSLYVSDFEGVINRELSHGRSVKVVNNEINQEWIDTPAIKIVEWMVERSGQLMRAEMLAEST